MMEEIATRPSVEYIPPLPPKGKQRGSTTYTHITNDESNINTNGFSATDVRMNSLSSMHSLVLNSKTPSATVFVAATQSDRPASTPSTDALNGPHVVTIRINTDTEKPKAPKISSVHLKSDVDFDTFKINELCKKNNSLVRINVDDNRPKILEHEELLKTDKAPYIYCNSFVNSMTNMVMSSGQCSPSDTLDSGTCSDLDGTPPPLPKKKISKSSSITKAISVTLISSTNGSSLSEVDFEDNESNISCDSLNSSELNVSVLADESHCEYSKREKTPSLESTGDPQLYKKMNNKDSSFLPQGLLQDIRDRSVRLNTVETESESQPEPQEEANQNINEVANIPKESAQLTSFRLVSQINNESKNTTESLSPTLGTKTTLISESTYEERKQQDKEKQEQICYSSHYFDADKFYEFHLNENQFDEVQSVSVGIKSDSEVTDAEYFAGVKDYNDEEIPSTIKSSKGTIRGVKNRVRAGIATFLQMHNTTKSYKEKDAGKVVIYTTTMGIVRSTYQRCVLVKKILRNLMVKFEERDVFMSTEYQDEIRDRMKSDQILVPQLFVDGQYIGVLITLAFYATGSYQTLVGQSRCHGNVSQPSVSRAIRQVTKALNCRNIFSEYVQFPKTREARDSIKRSFYRKYKLPGVIGCIDGTHGAIRPKQNEERYYNRKGYHSLNVMIICDEELNILCIDPSKPGATHDSVIWRDHPLQPCLNQKYNEEQIFLCLLSARQLHYDPVFAGQIVNACAVLHNIANKARLPVPQLTQQEHTQEESMRIAFEEMRSESLSSVARSTRRGNRDLLEGRAVQQALISRLWLNRSL